MNNLQEAVDLMKKYFYKIIKVDINSGDFVEIKMTGIEDSLTKENYNKWIENFILDSYVHKKDKERFKTFTNLEYIKKHNCAVKDYYRKLVNEEWRWVCFETEPCINRNYVMIYVRDVHDSRVSGLLLLDDLKEEKDRDNETGIFNYSKLTRVIDDFDRSNALSVGLLGLKIKNNFNCDSINVSQILIFSFGKDNCFRVNDSNFVVILPNITDSHFSSKMVKFSKSIKKEYDNSIVKYNAMWLDTTNKDKNLSECVEYVQKFL